MAAIANFGGWRHKSRDSIPCNWNTWRCWLFCCYHRHGRRVNSLCQKKVREKSRECHNYKPQPFPDIKRKRKATNPNKHKSIKRTKSPKIRGNRNAKRTEKHKNKMAQGKTYKKSPRRINQKAPKSKTNTGLTTNTKE